MPSGTSGRPRRTDGNRAGIPQRPRRDCPHERRDEAAEIVRASKLGLGNPEAPRVACFDERVLLYGGTALVVCEEELAGGTLTIPETDSRPMRLRLTSFTTGGAASRDRGWMTQPLRSN